MPKYKNINLLPQEEFEASTLGRVLRWGMGTFRIIVILTEMVVMTAFLSRFWLDAQNSDLSDKIKIQSAEISAQSSFEKEFRGLQTKLSIFSKISSSNQSSGIIGLIASKVPNGVTLSSISVSSNTVSINGDSQSDVFTAQLISNLESEKKFKNVELGGIDSSQDNPALTGFSIKISL